MVLAATASGAAWVLLQYREDRPAPHAPASEERAIEHDRDLETPDAFEPETSAAAVLDRLRIAQKEAERWAELLPSSSYFPLAARGESWVNVGPADMYRPAGSTALDSGRVTGIAVDPRDANIVYVATSGGGVWKTWSFESAAPNPIWHPITENLPNLAIGAIDLARSDPDTAYVGLGDPFDVGGNGVVKSVDGGGTWSSPAPLAGTYPPAAGSLPVTALSVRDIKVDPQNASRVFVATDVGLFRSTDGGAHYDLIDLPNTARTQVAEAIWSIAYAGGSGSTGQWLVTGLYACDRGWLPPWARNGVAVGVPSAMRRNLPCTLGNLGDIWRSTDSGETWTSLRGAGALPIPMREIGLIMLAAGEPPPGTPDSTVVYGLVSNISESASTTYGLWRSLDSGVSWEELPRDVQNPTRGSAPDCGDLNVGHGQSYYDLAIAVDPTNPDHVVMGGNFCGLRTLNGTSARPVFENVAHWAPGGTRGSVAEGPLPYVHADWHVAKVAMARGRVRAYSGGDGGLFSSTNVFDPNVAPVGVVWSTHNRGLVTHLVTGIGSGDPTQGNYLTVIAGLQDNGVMIRSSAANPTAFHKVIGADGFQAAVGKGTLGEFYLASIYRTHFLCITGTSDCTRGGSWRNFNPAIMAPDRFPFFTRFAAEQSDPTGAAFLTISNNAVWKSDFGSSMTPSWRQIGAFTGVRDLVASPNVPRLYGLALSGGRLAVSANAGDSWSTSTGRLGIAGTATIANLSSLSFAPTTPPNKQPGDLYVAASDVKTLADRSQPIPESVGHLFYTEDRGRSFVPLHGNGSGMDLPNVPIKVVRYDPNDETNQTIYAGTDLGLYRTRDGGATWARYGYGLPLVRVTDLFIARNSSLIRIATYGRGVWEIYPSSAAARGVNGDGDFDRDSAIDWVDLGAMASRLGTTPETFGWPTYLWIEDMVPGPASPQIDRIDDDDLRALLDVFGDHP